MPVIQATMWAGITDENKKKLVEGITKACEAIGIPADAVTVIIYEVPKKDWATAGQLHTERFPRP